MKMETERDISNSPLNAPTLSAGTNTPLIRLSPIISAMMLISDSSNAALFAKDEQIDYLGICLVWGEVMQGCGREKGPPRRPKDKSRATTKIQPQLHHRLPSAQRPRVL